MERATPTEKRSNSFIQEQSKLIYRKRQHLKNLVETPVMHTADSYQLTFSYLCKSHFYSDFLKTCSNTSKSLEKTVL